MSLLNLLLNLVALLFWFGWRAVGLDRTAKPPALSLVTTLKRAESRPTRAWPLLIAVAAVLILRSAVYWQLGPQLEWAPSLHFGLFSVGFRVDLWPHALTFSLASFLHAWVIAHVGLLLIILLNRRSPEAGPFQPFLNAQGGFLSRWHTSILILLVPLAGAAVWLGMHWPLLWLELTSAPPPGLPAVQQAAAFGLSLFLIWTYLALALLLIHLINTYIYFGNLDLWTCLAHAGRTLCRWLPIRIGHVDLAPPVVAALIVAASYAASLGIEALFTHPLASP